MQIKGREKEFKKIQNVIDDFKKNGLSRNIYISGVPGSGKTYTLKKALSGDNYIYVNACYLKSKIQVYKYIYLSLTCPKSYSSSYYSSLREHIESCGSKHIIIIDEIDFLIDRKQEILYNIFDLPYVNNSNILLILVSNTMNLPEKYFESKISSRIGKNRINFLPYSAKQLKSIMNSSSEDLSIEVITRKISSISGDVRVAMNINNKINRADFIERNNKKTKYDAINEILEPLCIKFIKNCSYYQKLILYVFMEYNDLDIKSIYNHHKVICKTKNYRYLNYFEYLDVLEVLKKYGIISFQNNRTININVFKEDMIKSLVNDEIYNSFRHQ